MLFTTTGEGGLPWKYPGNEETQELMEHQAASGIAGHAADHSPGSWGSVITSTLLVHLPQWGQGQGQPRRLYPMFSGIFRTCPISFQISSADVHTIPK